MIGCTDHNVSGLLLLTMFLFGTCFGLVISLALATWVGRQVAKFYIASQRGDGRLRSVR